ncbi:MAG: hypothetical protein EBR30_07865 [Cytophagia bacterium]|nr:hypothetical protein [Cytophagia bacterium]
MNKKIVFLILTLFISYYNTFPQTAGYVPHVKALPPNAYEFLKYGEIPVSEYSGVPSITIPIYSIKEGDISFPLSLTYHSSGIKVAEEASWVGLGWNLDIGNIVQVINDNDDLGNYQRVLPDYYYYPYRYQFPMRYSYPTLGAPSIPFQPSAGISQNQPYHSYVIYTDYQVPINGQYVRNPDLFNANGTNDLDNIDSEPDVFKLTINGQVIEFVLDFNTLQPIILNKRNYSIIKTKNAQGKDIWTLYDPFGFRYEFEEIEEVYTDISCTRLRNDNYCDGLDRLASRIWHLSEISSPTNRLITFNWTKSDLIKDLPNFAEKIKYKSRVGQYINTECSISGPFNHVDNTGTTGETINSEQIFSQTYSKTLPYARSYLESIDFGTGSITFSKSSRSDLRGTLKLDEITVKYKNQDVKKWKLEFDYFESTISTGSTDKQSPVYYTQYTSEELSQRLKLKSVREVGIGAYVFVYDPMQLPIKTSYAVDYWGYYNGANTNNSYIPNPSHLNKQILGDNGNDKRANLTYSKAAILKQIFYPTGGSTIFDYELNTFSNSSVGTITEGSGLRVKTVINSIETNQAGRTEYTYEEGKLINGFNIYGYYGYNLFREGSSIGTMEGSSYSYTYSFLIDYFSGNNFYSSAQLGSGNFIGYDRVTRSQLDLNGNLNGKSVTSFVNQQDVVATDLRTDLQLPATKNHNYPHNGLVLNEKVYDNNGLLRETTNQYEFKMSEIRYGARNAFSNHYCIKAYIISNGCTLYTYSQDIVGYYPIYSGESLLTSSIVVDRQGSQDFNTNIDYTYYSNHLLKEVTRKNSKNEVWTETTQYSGTPYQAQYHTLINQNILNRIVRKYTTKSGFLISDDWETYDNFSTLFLVNRVYKSYGGTGQIKILEFIGYDTYGNPIEMIDKDGLKESIVWGLNYTQPTSIAKNASFNQIAYSGFEEPTNKGGWVYEDLTDANSNTGNLSYSGGSISKDYLPLGDYQVSFFGKRKDIGSSGSVSGSITLVVNDDIWQFYTFKLQGITGVNFNLQNLLVDDIRIHPVTATMESYVYKPLIGIKAIIDANGLVRKFEYDSGNRLRTVSDDHGNILKQFKYRISSEE